MKKIISVLFAMLISISCISVNAFATTAEGKCGDNVTWHLEDGVLTISGSGPMYDYNYGQNSEVLNKRTPIYPIREEIVKVIIEPGVETIGGCFFEDCINLTEIIIPDTVVTIKRAAFIGCNSLETLEIPNGVTKIEERAFWLCKNLVKVDLPDGLESIGEYAFQYCEKLEGIVIPSSLNEISAGTFDGCRGLGYIELPEGIEKIGYAAFKGAGDLREFVLPDSIAEIDEYAFSGFWADKMLVPNTIKSLQKYAFRNSSIFEFYFKGTLEEFISFRDSVWAEGNGVGNEEFLSADVIIVGTRPSLSWGDQFLVKEEPTLDSHGVIQYLSPFGRVIEEAETPKLADINDDDSLDMKDALMMRKAVAGVIELTDEQIIASDLNYDNNLNLKDVLMIRKLLAGAME